jgi:hypothetical protein
MIGQLIKTYYWQCTKCKKYTRATWCPDCEDDLSKKHNFTIRQCWSNFNRGIVVKWNDGIYIVIHANENGIELIPVDYSNMTCSVSAHFPYDPSKRANSIAYVADNIKDYILKNVKKIFELK